MRVAIRADTSHDIGTGHVVRCDTLARELAGRGAEVQFLLRGLSDEPRPVLRDPPYRISTLPAGLPRGYRDVDVWPHSMQLEDARMTLAAFEGPAPDWIVVDHYHLDAVWEGSVRARGSRVMVIDDQANRMHDCELLLDQNYYPDMESRYAALVPAECRQLLGPRHALLRPEFQDVRRNRRARSGAVRRLLLSFGGGDVRGLTLLALRAVAALGADEMHVDVVLGDAGCDRSEIERVSRAMRSCEMHVQIGYMARLMAQADLAIGGAGVTSWERCACALPAIVTALAANQQPIAAGLERLGCAKYVGESRLLDEHTLCDALRALVGDPDRVRRMSEAAADLVDAAGAARVRQAMEGLQ